MTAKEAGASGKTAAATATLPVAERFVSINGEGTHAGRLATFIRFAGCNLACSYCDTTWANEPGCTTEQLSVEELAAYVADKPAACVTLTGGEPLLQPALPALVRALLKLPASGCVAGEGDLYVEIETNGSVDLGQMASLREELALSARGRSGERPCRDASLSFTMDCKMPSSGMGDSVLASNFALLDKRDTCKFVVGTQQDLQLMVRTVCEHNLTECTNVYLSPVFGQMNPADIVAFMQQHGLSQATLQLQLHKIIWPHVQKGV